jgi:DNA mismatch repair ATPase MutS
MLAHDATFARDVLKLHLTTRGKELTCRVPDKSFSEWALKIVNSGKRVCKVEQMEAAVDQQNKKSRKKVTKHVHQLESISLIVQLHCSIFALSTRAILQIC